MKGTELQYTVAVHLTNHTSMLRQDFRDENMEDLSGMPGMGFSLIGPGAMGGQSLNSPLDHVQFTQELTTQLLRTYSTLHSKGKQK